MSDLFPVYKERIEWNGWTGVYCRQCGTDYRQCAQNVEGHNSPACCGACMDGDTHSTLRVEIGTNLHKYTEQAALYLKRNAEPDNYCGCAECVEIQAEKFANRPTIDDTMLDTAEVWSRRSTCSRLSVGAVLAHGDYVIGTGYNGAPSGLDHCVHTDNEPCKRAVHAEANALLSAGRRTGASTDGSTLYLTHAPCLACSGLIINAGVYLVVYIRDYRSDDGIKALRQGGVLVHQV